MAMERELLRHCVKKPCTIIYPFEKLPATEGLRGRHVYYPEKCIGCGLCARVCPSFAIELLGGPGQKCEGVKIDLGKCLFCQQCQEVCPRGALELTKEYELAALTHEGCVLIFERKQLEQQDKKE